MALAGKLNPDLIFLDVKMPGLDGISAASTIMTRQPRPIILLTAWSERDLVQRAQEAGVLAYLVKPVREAELVPVIEVAMARFAELRALQQEVGNLKETLETRKLVDRAKGILMQREGIDEQEAFLRIQRQSRNTRTPMREIARAILVSDEMRQHTPARPAGRIEVRTPADLPAGAERGRASCPAPRDQQDFVVSGAEPLGVPPVLAGHRRDRGRVRDGAHRRGRVRVGRGVRPVARAGRRRDAPHDRLRDPERGPAGGARGRRHRAQPLRAAARRDDRHAAARDGHRACCGCCPTTRPSGTP